MASRPARLMTTAARELCGAAVLTVVTCVLASCQRPHRPAATCRTPGPGRPGLSRGRP